jgi:formylglycine-generating enzyme required for sulfatase activity
MKSIKQIHSGKSLTSALLMLILLAFGRAYAASPPVVSNVSGRQRTDGSKLVDITYTISDADSTNVSISVLISKDSGVTWDVPAVTFTGDYGGNIAVSATPTPKAIVWNAGADWDGQFSTNCRARVIANDANPDGFVTIPAGSFVMGDSLGDSVQFYPSNSDNELPTKTFTLSQFRIEKTMVTGARWQAVAQWALLHNYSFLRTYSTAGSLPVTNIYWDDALIWCNARSEMEGLVPVYYTTSSQTTVLRSAMDIPGDNVKWSANGYRLPTEAEWEKAARGGLPGKRFPWGDTISQAQANYYSTNQVDGYNGTVSLTYDISPTRGCHPIYACAASPVASFGPNGYGLFDLVGNGGQFCWGIGPYSSLPTTDPRGPLGSAGAVVAFRGALSAFGIGADTANILRCSYRGLPIVGDPTRTQESFRCVKAP